MFGATALLWLLLGIADEIPEQGALVRLDRLVALAMCRDPLRRHFRPRHYPPRIPRNEQLLVRGNHPELDA